MIHTDINYPSELPWPTKEDYTARTVSPFVRNEMQNGRAMQRRKFTNVPTDYTVTWVFTSDAEAALFEAWFRDAIYDGAAWFNMPLKTPIGEAHYVCRFKTMYTGPDLIGLCSWRASAVLEMFERPLLDRGWGLLPGFVTGMSIFDKAMNREWPEADQ